MKGDVKNTFYDLNNLCINSLTPQIWQPGFNYMKTMLCIHLQKGERNLTLFPQTFVKKLRVLPREYRRN